MPYKERIKEIAIGFPGVLERVDLLNSHLSALALLGLERLIENFLSNKNIYTLTPFLFEIFVGRFILSFSNVENVEYEPDDQRYPPDFRFRIADKLFHTQVKTILQIHNEQTKKKIIKQVNDRIASLTNNVIEIWLSKNIDQRDLNGVVDWLVTKAVNLADGGKDIYNVNNETFAWVKVMYVSKNEGQIGIEHIGGTSDELVSEINVDRVREQIRQKLKQANKRFPLSDDSTFNLLFVTYDSHILLSLSIIQEVLYGTEEFVAYSDGCRDRQLYQHLKDNGVWNKPVFTNTDILFFFMPGVDFLDDLFEPYVFINPHRIQKVRTIPEPFKSMKTHIPCLYFGPRKLEID